MFSMLINHIAKCCCVLLFLVLPLPVYATQQTAATNPEREAALKLLQAKQYPEAAKAWKQFLNNTNNKNDAEAWMYFGIALYRNDKLGEATDALEKSVKLNPQSELAHSAYATILYAANKFPEARREVIETLRLNANNQEALYLRGVLQYGAGAFSEALTDAKKVLELAPDFAPAYLLKAQVLTGQFAANNEAVPLSKEWKSVFLEAAQQIEKYLKLSPTAADSTFWQERMNTLRFYGDGLDSATCLPSTKDLHPKFTHIEKVRLTEEARNNRITGTIRLHAIYDVDGQVKHILPLSYLGGGLTLEAIKSAQKTRFKPAMKDGKPVCVFLTLEFGFYTI
jgi:tetratricopeptide (TPR) repeat protein